jgi:hypothetical protein
MQKPIARYSIGPVNTKDLKLWERYKALQLEGETAESMLRRGIEELEQDHIKDLTQNNKS